MQLPDDVVKFLVEHAKDTEWQYRHAAENTYCMHCNKAWRDACPHCQHLPLEKRRKKCMHRTCWQDQTEHHPECPWLTTVAKVKEALHAENPH